jgi:flagellar hook-associated protein 2
MKEGEDMAINGLNSTSTFMRLSGLGTSGLDTDSVVSQLMKAERVPLDKLTQKKQLSQWRQDDYRGITNILRGFKSDYFDVVKPSNYMLSQATFKKLTAASSDSTVVTASGGLDAVAGSHTITVNKIASAEKIISGDNVTKALEATPLSTSLSGQKINVSLDGVTKEITLDNYSSLDDLITKVDTGLQAVLDRAFGAGKIAVSNASGKLRFDTTGGAGKIVLTSGSTSDGLSNLGFVSGASNRISVSDTLEVLADKMGTALVFSNDQVSLTINNQAFIFDKTTTLSSMMNTINSNSLANVNLSYNDVDDKFIITSKQTGAGENISLSESGSNFFTAAGFNSVTGGSAEAALQNYTGGNNKGFSVSIDGVLKDITLVNDYSVDPLNGGANPPYLDNDTAFAALSQDIKTQIESQFSGKTVSVSVTNGNLSISLTSGGSSLSVGEPSSGTSALTDLGLSATYIQGEDASVVLDNQTLIRSDNKFTVNGVSYTLIKENPNIGQTVTLTQDVDSVYDSIKKFVDKYNEIIGTINGKTDEKYDRDYQPLTEEQKDAMNDTDITSWETMAKTGLLHNDSILQSITREMRTALSDSVLGISTSLSAIGITTGNYADKGKLIIDETKLKDALQKDSDSVMNLFTKQSSITSNLNISEVDRATRYTEEGLAYRLSDIIDKNITTIRDSSGRKGILLEKAGIPGDLTEYTSEIFKQITDFDTRISSLNVKLADKENAYYAKFTAMEIALEKMNSQSNWLASQFSSSSQ